ncbi:hypothetical protein [Streptomyces sp. NPDC101237]|uniref:hypothetical protein n=1 Tax=Streptomyces sp. NPDC101237 TaxID=3366139 RepID=UPI00380934BD
MSPATAVPPSVRSVYRQAGSTSESSGAAPSGRAARGRCGSWASSERYRTRYGGLGAGPASLLECSSS